MRIQAFRKIFICSFIVALMGASSVLALEVPTAPNLSQPIVDQTNTLTPEQIAALSSKISTSRAEKSYQIGILIIPTLEDEALEPFSIEVARKWGIGVDSKDNGVLFLVAKNDRKMRIEVGRGLEGDLTDLRSSRILRNIVKPKFAKGDYYGGIDLGVTEIQNAVSGKPESNELKKSNQSSGANENIFNFVIFILFFGSSFLSWIIAMLARSKSWWAGGLLGAGVGGVVSMIFSFSLFSILAAGGLTILGLMLDYLVSKNYKKYKNEGKDQPWWTGGTWIGGSGGSGWGGGSDGGSFGGGDFGGGGASGDW